MPLPVWQVAWKYTGMCQAQAMCDPTRVIRKQTCSICLMSRVPCRLAVRSTYACISLDGDTSLLVSLPYSTAGLVLWHSEDWLLRIHGKTLCLLSGKCVWEYGPLGLLRGNVAQLDLLGLLSGEWD